MDVKTACLGVLACAPASGYEIRKQFEAGPFSHFAEGAFGSIYPALKQLEREGKVASVARAQDGRPPKKVFSLTPEGKLALVDAMLSPPAPDKYKSDFLFLMFFAAYLPARWVEDLIEARLTEERALLARMNDPSHCDPDAAPAGQAFVYGFGRAITRATIAYLEAHKHEIVAAALRGEEAAAE